jgi:GNAT superfamily N-acetyltransferase
MVWRQGTRRSGPEGRAERKAGIQNRVQANEPLGLLGYLDGTPVAWCSVAPRDTYRALGRPAADGDSVIWSLVCFFLPRALRGRGLGRQLLDAAIAAARKHGADILEAYPVEPESHSYRFMGLVPMFETAGFREVGRAGSRRHVMRLDLEK